MWETENFVIIQMVLIFPELTLDWSLRSPRPSNRLLAYWEMTEIYWEHLGVSESLHEAEQYFYAEGFSWVYSLLLDKERECHGFAASYERLVSSEVCGIVFIFSICLFWSMVSSNVKWAQYLLQSVVLKIDNILEVTLYVIYWYVTNRAKP